MLGVNHLLLFVGDCPHHHRHPLCYCCYSLSLRLVSLSYFAFFETIPGGGAQRESWGGGQKASKPTSLRMCQAHACERAGNWLSPDWDRDMPG